MKTSLKINKTIVKSTRKAVKSLKKMSLERRMINLLNLLDCCNFVLNDKISNSLRNNFKNELTCIKEANRMVRNDEKKLVEIAVEKYKKLKQVSGVTPFK